MYAIRIEAYAPYGYCPSRTILVVDGGREEAERAKEQVYKWINYFVENNSSFSSVGSSIIKLCKEFDVSSGKITDLAYFLSRNDGYKYELIIEYVELW